MIQVVKVEHKGSRQQFLFTTEKAVKNGDLVAVSTKFGEAMGTCTCDSFFVGEDVLESLEAVACYTLPLREVIGVVVPTAEMASSWNRVEDYPPMNGETVLVTRSDINKVVPAVYESHNGVMRFSHAVLNIPIEAEAWMPMPKPYVEGKDEEHRFD